MTCQRTNYTLSLIVLFRFAAGDRAMTHEYELLLPSGLSCDQCVFQWKYHAGKLHGMWGTFQIKTGIKSQRWPWLTQASL